jgi:AcrR family transcriptional regulator
VRTRSVETAARGESLRRIPKQQRSQEIVEAILEAAARLLKQDLALVSTTAIADRAGVSVGSVYRYFPNKEAILAALYERDVGAEARGLSEDPRWLPGDSPLRSALAQLVDFQLERHRRLRDLDQDFYRGHHRDFSLARKLGAREVEARIRRFLAEHAAELRVRDLDQAAFVVARGVSGLVRTALDECPEKLDDPAFREELVDLLACYAMAPR